ncbi:hypothetical protein PR048_013090 [Dryococelus australis]|uniref:Integrase catalytic domain-containing protein n=1 Tax=Dryococelus australis TaxID=614101 RepID=A0ABQ9HR67_9NEOP|nr:hypothetical protein PR048_013090 [Dryococelus australis]
MAYLKKCVQFTSAEFQKFAKKYGFLLTTSSPKFAQPNGKAESAVKVAKNILSKSTDPNLGLLVYRATPLESGLLPAELLFGSALRTTLPVINLQQQPTEKRPEFKAFCMKDQKLKECNKINFNRRHGAKELRQLARGECGSLI